MRIRCTEVATVLNFHLQSEYIATCDMRLKFVSGFSGSRGFGVVTRQAAAMWTDGRYFLQVFTSILLQYPT